MPPSLRPPERLVPDDTLRLPTREGPAAPPAATFSVSAAKAYLNCPQAYYLDRVSGVGAVAAVPLVEGGAYHAAFEALDDHPEARTRAAVTAFERALRSGWAALPPEALERRVNPADPTQPKGKASVPYTLDEALARGRSLLAYAAAVLEGRLVDCTPVAHYFEGARHEIELGRLAAERGMPTATALLRRGEADRVEPSEVAVIDGVPMHGYVDRVSAWPDGTPLLLDHKTVSAVIPFWGPSRKPFEPSYDPATDLQLDVYAGATDIPRAGFQFFLKLPQYVPPGGLLHPHWVEEAAWRTLERPGHRLPMGYHLDANGDLRYLVVWRPAPSDHPSRPEHYATEAVRARAARVLRPAVETITEGLLLLEEGVEPEVAFPPGRPADVGRLCPYCPHFDATCPAPQHAASPNERRALEERATERATRRATLCAQTPAIRERHALWRRGSDR